MKEVFENCTDQIIAQDGLHNAVVVDVIWIPEAPGRFKQVRLVWEVEQALLSGKRLTVTKYYSSMNQILDEFDRALGPRHPLVTEESRDLDLLIGVPCRVQVVHNQKKDQSWFAHVQTVMPASSQQLEPSSLYVRMKDRPQAAEDLPKAA